MRPRILVAYASRAGSTAEVAEVIGRVLREGGPEVDVCPVGAVHSLAGYDALVLGSAI
jgi:menaquinone-dependent protoporphyrinogen oxidase